MVMPREPFKAARRSAHLITGLDRMVCVSQQHAIGYETPIIYLMYSFRPGAARAPLRLIVCQDVLVIASRDPGADRRAP